MNDQQLQPPQSPPPNYLVWAILTTILCCLPFGIVSIIFAAQVNSKWTAGDYEAAQNASKNAKTWAWVSFGVGISALIIYLIALSVGIGALAWLDGFDF
jgi:hypothetical protein